ncbi:hypothetical protein [Rhizobium pisi]
MPDEQIYAKAGEIIKIGMGFRYVGAGRAREKVWLADEDPLAYWNGVEAIVSLVRHPSPSQGEVTL